MENLRRRISWRAEDLTQGVISKIDSLIEGYKIEQFYHSNQELTDWQALEIVSPFLFDRLSERTLHLIQQQIGEVDTALDIGAGSNPLKSIIFGNTSEVIAVDPGYFAYEMDDYPGSLEEKSYHISGSRWQKAEMIRELKRCLKQLEIPKRIEGADEHIIRGTRHGRQRTIRLVPADASLWIKNYHQPVRLIVVWRAFPPAETWGDILAALSEGGVLITTGYGEALPGERDFPRIIAGTDNTALPRNRKTKAIGLEPLVNPHELFTDSDDRMTIYFIGK